MKMTTQELWKAYSATAEWKNVTKTHENLFSMGVQSVLLRGEKLLHDFFNHKSDANKYLDCDEQTDLEKDFGKWCSENATNKPKP